MDDIQIKNIIEALLFVSEKPLTIEQIVEVLEEVDLTKLKEIINKLCQEYETPFRSMKIQHVAGGYQMCTRPEYATWIRRLFNFKQSDTLSKPAIETLSIIAYKQPIARQEIEFIRGVNVEGVLRTLLEKGLIRIAGRKDSIGRPIIYRTNRLFLEYFGLNSLNELPPLPATEKTEGVIGTVT